MDVMLKEKFFHPLRDLLQRMTKQHKMIFVKPFAVHVRRKFGSDIYNIFPLKTSFWSFVLSIGVSVECALVHPKRSFIRLDFTFFIDNDGL